jgi:Leucine-rich repeat (LRR) protein
LLLDKNCIDLVDSGPFPAHLSKLKMLSLSKNIINNLPEDMFDNLVSLSHLDLSYNQLSSVRRGNFSRLKCLKVLSLKSNAIEFIEPGSFDELGQLVTLNLKRNQLKSGLAIDLLKGLVSLQALKIEEGVLAVEVREYIKSKNISTIF